MNWWIENILYFFICFLIITLVYIFRNRKRKEYKEGKKYVDIDYVKNRFKLDMRKTKYKSLVWTLSLINTFIISFTTVLLVNIDGFIWKMLIGFVVLMLLIFSLYEITGRIFKRREDK